MPLSCTIIETLSDSRACPPEKPPYDGNGDGMGDVKIDDFGNPRTMCEIPQTGACITNDCNLACDDPGAQFQKCPGVNGWWYNPFEQGVAGVLPTVHLEGGLPAAGSTVFIQCPKLDN